MSTIPLTPQDQAFENMLYQTVPDYEHFKYKKELRYIMNQPCTKKASGLNHVTNSNFERVLKPLYQWFIKANTAGSNLVNTFIYDIRWIEHQIRKSDIYILIYDTLYDLVIPGTLRNIIIDDDYGNEDGDILKVIKIQDTKSLDKNWAHSYIYMVSIGKLEPADRILEYSIKAGMSNIKSTIELMNNMIKGKTSLDIQLIQREIYGCGMTLIAGAINNLTKSKDTQGIIRNKIGKLENGIQTISSMSDWQSYHNLLKEIYNNLEKQVQAI